jgi:hypothetical protein
MAFEGEATPFILRTVTYDDDEEVGNDKQHYDSFEDDTPKFTRVHHHRRTAKQLPTSPVRSESGGQRGFGSSIFAKLNFGSAWLNFTMNYNGDYDHNNGQHHASREDKHHHLHRRSPQGSIFNFGSTLLEELSNEFTDYEEMEGSLALDALFSMAQPSADGTLEHIRHPTLDPGELVKAAVLIYEEELDYGDLRWSLLSNTFFIFGGFFECFNNIWELIMNGEENINTLLSVLKIGVTLLGPLVYCCNSIVDITWAVRVEQRLDRRQQLDDLDIDLIAPDKVVEVVTESPDSKGQTKKRLRLPFEPHNVWRRLRRHIGHRRVLSAAITFGIGAALEFSKSYLGLFSTRFSDEGLHIVDAMCVNFYAASAVFALSKNAQDERRRKPWAEVWHDAPRLESLGDTFFGIASAVDCAICYFRLDELGEFIFIWPLISASLWVFDALCYLRADVNSMTLYNASRPLGHAVTSNNTSCSSSFMTGNNNNSNLVLQIENGRGIENARQMRVSISE